jgi:hypothetical protein
MQLLQNVCTHSLTVYLRRAEPWGREGRQKSAYGSTRKPLHNEHVSSGYRSAVDMMS